MSSSKLTVLIIVVLSVAVLVALWFYIDERGTQRQLADVDCAALLPTTFELQGKIEGVARDETCELLRVIAAMEPNGDDNANDAADPWHYFGRLRIRPANDAWFLVFMARRSDNFKPVFSLRHRRGSGWSVVGLFDAKPVLERLGALGRIDMAKLQSDSSLTPVDQMVPMAGE